MSISTHHNILFRLCLLFTFVTCLWFFSGRAESGTKLQDSTKFEKRIPVTTHQLPANNGIIPIELMCEDAELSAPNALEKLACVIKNKTDEYITAGALHTSLTLDKEGKSIAISSYNTFDTFLHPDFRADHPNNLLPPGGTYRLDDLPSSFDASVVIKAITVRIDYAEFADNSMLGPNRGGARIIADTREGAAKYKQWLAQQYNQSRGALERIVFLLDKHQPLPEELEIQNSNQEQGASMYRNFARRTYENKGGEDLIKHLKQ